MAQAALNPFWEDDEVIPASQAAAPTEQVAVAGPSGIKRETKRSASSAAEKKPKRAYKKKEKAQFLPPASALASISSDSESDEAAPAAPVPAPIRKRKRVAVTETEDEIVVEQREPVRAAPLRSFLNQRTPTGYTSQSDPARTGDYYFELRVYNSREIERIANTERWKRSVVTMKLSTDLNTPMWKALTRIVQAGRDEFKNVQPILYTNNPF